MEVLRRWWLLHFLCRGHYLGEGMSPSRTATTGQVLDLVPLPDGAGMPGR